MEVTEQLTQIQMSVEMMRATVIHVENLVCLLGTPQDNKTLRKELDTTREQAKELEKSITNKLSNLKIDQKDLFSNFNLIREKWCTLYRDSYQKQMSLPSLPDEASTASIENTLRQQQITKQYGSKQEVMSAIVKERNEQILELKKGAIEVRDLFVETAKLVECQKPTFDAIEMQLEEAQQQTEEGLNTLAKAAKDQALSLPVSGAAVGGVVGGGLGMLLGPVGVVIGGTTGATVGSMVGSSIGKFQKEIVDKEMFERYLKERWISDERVLNCMLCKIDFTSMVRKHHCRACGGIFCWQCSDKKLAFKLPNFESERMERVCRTCFQEDWMLHQN